MSGPELLVPLKTIYELEVRESLGRLKHATLPIVSITDGTRS